MKESPAEERKENEWVERVYKRKNDTITMIIERAGETMMRECIDMKARGPMRAHPRKREEERTRLWTPKDRKGEETNLFEKKGKVTLTKVLS